MILITSADYVGSCLVAEFGKLPPSMLPLQNKRLYQHQLDLILENEHIVLTLPLGYTLTQYDKEILAKKNVTVVFVPLGMSLGKSILYALSAVDQVNDPLKILHGDTLFQELPSDLDVNLVAHIEDNYKWSSPLKKEKNIVYTGYFSFSNQKLFIEKIIEKDYDFIKGVKAYSDMVTLINSKTNSWMDFGLINTYYRSKSNLTTQRVFNDLKISQFSVKKLSSDKKKMHAEAKWFENAPYALKSYLPSLWGYGEEEEKGYYEIEYFYLSTLSDLYVFALQPLFVWEKIFSVCAAFLNTCHSEKPPLKEKFTKSGNALYGKKTELRLAIFSKESKLDLNKRWIYNGEITPSINDILTEINQDIDLADESFVSVMHGDFCFSNILFNFKTQSIKVIDPRGIDLNGNQTIYGDIRYDVAKLAHSVIGLYDFIVAGKYSLKFNTPYDIEFDVFVDETTLDIQNSFLSFKIGDFSLKELNTFPILIHLFLSMLPLHNDKPDRQKALLANAFRIYAEYKKKNIFKT